MYQKKKGNIVLTPEIQNIAVEVLYEYQEKQPLFDAEDRYTLHSLCNDILEEANKSHAYLDNESLEKLFIEIKEYVTDHLL